MRCLTLFGIFSTSAVTGTGLYLAFHMASVAADECILEIERFTSEATDTTMTLPEFNLNVTIDLPTLTLPVNLPEIKYNFTGSLPGMTLPFTTPDISMNATSIMPKTKIPVELFGQRVNVTAPGGNAVTIPIHVPSSTVNITTPDDVMFVVPVNFPLGVVNITSPDNLAIRLPIHIPPILINISDLLGKNIANTSDKIGSIAGKLCYTNTLTQMLMATSIASLAVANLTCRVHQCEQDKGMQSKFSNLHREVQTGFELIRVNRPGRSATPKNNYTPDFPDDPAAIMLSDLGEQSSPRNV